MMEKECFEEFIEKVKKEKEEKGIDFETQLWTAACNGSQALFSFFVFQFDATKDCKPFIEKAKTFNGLNIIHHAALHGYFFVVEVIWSAYGLETLDLLLTEKTLFNGEVGYSISILIL
jgi:hypothetical protein